MKHVYENPGGVDVLLTVEPEIATSELSPELLNAVDRLATASARLDPAWQIDLVLGWSRTTRVHITATPAPTEGAAA